MDQEALVERLIEAGAQLDLELRRRGGGPRTAPVVALDAETNQWILLVALPINASRLKFYHDIQEIILRIGLSIELAEVILIKENDPGFGELQGNAIPGDATSRINAAPVEVGGRVFTAARLVRISGLTFVTALASAVQRCMPAGWSIEGEAWVDGYSEDWHLPPVDVALRRGNQMVLFEVKALRMPLSTRTIYEALGMLTYFQHESPDDRRLSLVLISMSGFTSSAKSRFDSYPNLWLVAWRPDQGDAPIADVLNAISTDAST